MQKKTKTLWIILIAALVLLAVFVIVYVLVIKPRIVIQKAVEAYKDDLVAAEYITDFSHKEDDIFDISNEYFSAEIPSRFMLDNVNEEMGTEYYKDDISGDAIMLCYVPNNMYKSLLDGANYHDDKVLEDAGIDNPEDMVATLCYETPDSYYNSMKSVVLLDSKDYDFWNMDKAVSFYILGSIKEACYKGYIPYVYERDDIYAIISRPEKEGWGYIIDMVRSDNLNTTYLIVYNTDNMDNIIAFMNSLEFK